MRKIFRLLTIALVGGVSLALGIVGLALPVNAMINGATNSIPNPLLDIFKQQAEESTVYADDGSVLAVLSAAVNRTPVTLQEVPQTLVNAVVDTEDSRFFTHGGVDIKSTVRALASDVKSGATVQGASTITQQLVKTVLNTPEKTLSRKIKDAVIADRLEQRYTKDQILEAYLNAVYFGNGAYGVDAAAQTYFDENVSQVTTVQGALLAGMIRDPEGYDPILNPNDSTARRNYVLQRMVAQGDLSAGAATTLSATPIPTSLTQPEGTANAIEDYYVSEVKSILLDNTNILGSTYSDRYNELFEGGLKIYTNLDPRLQGDADKAVADDFPAYDSKHGFATALASIDPTTGDVRAIVGGPGFDKLKYDLAITGQRQPGSGFKIFTLLAAYESGFGPNDTIDGSSPCAIKFGDNTSLLKKPIHNDGNESFGTITLTSATANSVNCAFIRLAHEVGLQKVVDMAHRLGLTETFPLNPSLVIGTEETSVLEMADAYATLADDGIYHAPSFISHIVDPTGDTIYSADTTGKRVLAPQISREAVATLRAVVEYGTGTAAALPDRPVVGKTGTTEDNTDAWFNGVTPQLTTSVWMGDPGGRVPMVYPNTLIDEFGADTPTEIWHDYTEAALANQPVIAFPVPDPSEVPPVKFITSSQLQADSPFGYNNFPSPTFVPSNGPPSTTSRTVPSTSPPTTPPISVPRTTPTTCITPPSIPGRTFPSPPFCA